MATKREVERKLRELIRRVDGADPDARGSLAGALPDRRVIQVVVTDLGATYWTELQGGRMGMLHAGTPTEAQIRVELSGDHLVELVDGRRSLFSSYLGGQVKIQASMGDLLRLRKLA
jgi:SCP-2 sterol transfer family